MATKKIFMAVIAVCALFILTSCAVNKLDNSLDYRTNRYAPSKPFEGTLGVDEFTDMRPQGTTSDAKKWIGFIPGVLWIDYVSETPDTYTGFSSYNSFPFKSSFARAIYRNIGENGLFEKTVFLPEERYAKTAWRLEGIIRQTTLKERCYYYGSGFYAWFTRIIGLPYVSYETDLHITLRLRSTGNDNIIWTYELKGSGTDRYYNIYQLMTGKEEKHILSYIFSRILEEKMPAAMESMKEALK
ncbi:MAG: hypothetical protein EHM30_03350 [Desulfobacteraceae bacterium]|nr:MAG: hypothetical protein EHM30_03350 [Desulfobacteraceae bacterium]